MAAPTTVKTVTLDGSTRDFEIPFEYLARKFVVLTLIGTDRKELVLNVDYRFTQRTIVTTTQVWGPDSGYNLLEIKRVTSATERLVDFSDGSILRASDLNTATVQALHIAEEGRDIATDTIGVDNDGNLDARGRRIVNLADAVSDGDSVTLRQEKTWAASTLNNALRAETAAQSSEGSAVRSKSDADRAKSEADSVRLSIESMKRAVRVPLDEDPQPFLPAAAARAGRLVGFDVNGDVVVTAPVEGTATALALALAGPDGYSMVGGVVSSTALASAGGGALVGVHGGTLDQYVGERVSATQYGLSTSGTPQGNSKAIMDALDANDIVFIPAGRYVCDRILLTKNNKTLYGAGWGTILVTADVLSLTLQDGSSTKQVGLLHVDSLSATEQISGYSISSMQLEGTVSRLGFKEHEHLVSLNGARSFTFNHMLIRGFRGDGIVLGSGGTDAAERHNNHIYGDGVCFDGINKQNRQCLSIVDGSQVRFSNGYMINSTRSDMPGAMDIEPMNKFETCQDIEVSGYFITNVGGSSGVMGFYADSQGLGVDKFLNPPRNIRFVGNTIIDCNNTGGAFGMKLDRYSAGPTGPRNEVLIAHNYVVGTTRVGIMIGMSGVRHVNNTYRAIGGALHVGQKVGGGMYDFESSGNTYFKCGSNDGVVVWVSTVSTAKFDDTFLGCGRVGPLQYGIVAFIDGSSDHIHFSTTQRANLSIQSVRVISAHTTSVKTNTLGKCVIEDGRNDFLRYYTPDEVITDTQLTINSPHSAFPMGHSVLIVESDPTWGFAVLNTYRYVSNVKGNSTYTSWQVMETDPSSPETVNTYKRRTNVTTGAWSAWRIYRSTE